MYKEFESFFSMGNKTKDQGASKAKTTGKTKGKDIYVSIIAKIIK